MARNYSQYFKWQSINNYNMAASPGKPLMTLARLSAIADQLFDNSNGPAAYRIADLPKLDGESHIDLRISSQYRPIAREYTYTNAFGTASQRVIADLRRRHRIDAVAGA
jgi:hypothetical protein